MSQFVASSSTSAATGAISLRLNFLCVNLTERLHKICDFYALQLRVVIFSVFFKLVLPPFMITSLFDLKHVFDYDVQFGFLNKIILLTAVYTVYTQL